MRNLSLLKTRDSRRTGKADDDSRPGGRTAFSKKKKLKGFSGQRRNLSTASTGDALRSAGRLVTQAVTSYARDHAGAEDKTLPPGLFKDAYASILRSVPKMHRIGLLQAMKLGLDEVARAEMDALAPKVAGDAPGKVSTEAFMAGLAAQEASQYASDVAAGALLSGAQMRARLQVTPQALSAALKARRMFALPGPSGGYAYPAFFADPAYDRRVLERVCRELGGISGGSKWDFFTTPRISLDGETPLQALARGKVDAVLAAAGAFRDD